MFRPLENKAHGSIMQIYETRLYERDKVDDVFEYMQDKLYREIMKEFNVFHGEGEEKKKLLDVGCGIGGLIPYTGVVNYYGIDISQPNINYIYEETMHGQYNESINVRKGDIRKRLPYKDNTFDYVVCTEVFEHLTIHEIKEVLTEIKRVSKKDAHIIITVPSLHYLWAYLPWSIYPFKKRSHLSSWIKNYDLENYESPHIRFKPKWFKKFVAEYLKVEKIETTFWFNNRAIHGHLVRLQKWIHQLSWWGQIGIGNNIILRCKNEN